MLKTKRKKNTIKFKNINVVLFLIVIVGLTLRLIGIKHAFPFIFHPDEPTIVRSALGVRFDPNPEHFDWPHLYIYLNYFLYMGFSKFREVLTTIGLREKAALAFPLIWDEKLIFYYLTRCFSAVLGALTAIPVYLTGKSLFGKKAGFLAALAIAIMPYHVWHSHYSLGDVPMVFFLSWGLYFSSLIIKRSDVRNYIFSGLFIGLSASVKYNGGLSALMVPAAHFLRVFWERKYTGTGRQESMKVKILDFKSVLALFLSGFSALVGFLIGTPYALFDFKTFSSKEYGKGAFWQFENVGSVSFLEHVSAFFNSMVNKLAVDTGYIAMPIYLFGFAYLVYRFVKRKMEQKDVFLSFLYTISLFLIWYISGFENNRSHYYFIYYPFLAVIFGFFVEYLQDWAVKNVVNLKNKTLSKALVFCIAPLLFSPLFIKSSINSYRFYRGDTRNSLHSWLISNYDPTETLVHNDKEMQDVFGSLGISSVKGLGKFDEYNKSLVVVSNPGSEEKKLLKKNEKCLKEVIKFDSTMRIGKDIYVYRYVSSPVN